MEKIEHSVFTTNGINIHVASIGSGPPILFLHGFPELWYSWRHQMLALSALGFRCIAPDLRGYGDSDSPLSLASYSSTTWSATGWASGAAGPGPCVPGGPRLGGCHGLAVQLLYTSPIYKENINCYRISP
ncbi:hypothetical protein TIFTF001_040436 [Ficus carica]|uniref:AB hydrolase-1 domain-containing protein n=1 Tax=Ficus carica TaxID=3494 RepID=A0AA88CJA5_FICCA|nr:hypothetical protein TIFTF001_040436 [Ficus carica]